VQVGQNIKTFDGSQADSPSFTNMAVGTIISATWGRDERFGGGVVLDVTNDVATACVEGSANVPFGNTYRHFGHHTEVVKERTGLMKTWSDFIDNDPKQNDKQASNYCALRITYTDPHNVGMILSNGGAFSFGIVIDASTVSTSTFAENSTWPTDHRFGSIVSAMWGSGTHQWDVAELVKVYNKKFSTIFGPTAFWMGGNPSPTGVTNTLTIQSLLSIPIDSYQEGGQCTTTLNHVGKAMYGEGKMWYDVTRLVKDMATNGTINFAVNYAYQHWVDPIPHIWKSITITRLTPVTGDFFTEGKIRFALFDPTNGRHTF